MAVSGIGSDHPDIEAYYDGSYNSANQDAIEICRKMLHDFLSEVKQNKSFLKKQKSH
jgi:hypothetical protein